MFGEINKNTLDEKNRELLIHNKKLSDIIFDVDVLHYRRINIEEATKFNQYLKKINSELLYKLEDIYDI
jgi:DNA primase catalytic subunit